LGLLKNSLLKKLMLNHVLNAEAYNNLLKVPRNLFATPEDKSLAYFDLSLPLIYNQTISEHCIVALRTQITKIGKMVLPCSKFSLFKVNCLTKNKSEALGAKIIPGVWFLPMTDGVPK